MPEFFEQQNHEKIWKHKIHHRIGRHHEGMRNCQMALKCIPSDVIHRPNSARKALLLIRISRGTATDHLSVEKTRAIHFGVEKWGVLSLYVNSVFIAHACMLCHYAMCISFSTILLLCWNYFNIALEFLSYICSQNAVQSERRRQVVHPQQPKGRREQDLQISR